MGSIFQGEIHHLGLLYFVLCVQSGNSSQSSTVHHQNDLSINPTKNRSGHTG